ncbi:MAG: hypothetical protein ACLQVK_09300 [Acidimicrobiales bacterium]|jgi:hypothetical protein
MTKLISFASVGLMVSTGAAAMFVAGAGAASAQTTTTSTTVASTPVQGAHSHSVVVYVDTVTGGGTPKPAGDCLEENQFLQGQLVVFRMYADDSSAGGAALTSSNTEAAYVTVPGVGKISMDYSGHQTSPGTTVGYWEVPWSTKGYPVGTVNFTVTVVAKPLAQWGVAKFASSKVPAQAGVFSQKGWASESDLTVVAS